MLLGVESLVDEDSTFCFKDRAVKFMRILFVALLCLLAIASGTFATRAVAEDRPKVSSETFEIDGHKAFFVRDNGIGFETEFAEQIFGLFKRLNHQKDYPGTGLGLAICRRIIEHHGGQIWAKSEKGVGSEFSFSLPVEAGWQKEGTDGGMIGAANESISVS